MDKIKKLLRKLTKPQRDKLQTVITALVNKDYRGLSILKLKNSDLYRVRAGRYRIIFHHDKKNIIIDSIKIRNEKTYK